MQGISLAPVLDDPKARVRDHVLVEEDQMFDLAGLGQPLRMRSLLCDEGRITLYRGSPGGELFDFARDPGELSNLYGRAEARELQVELLDRLTRRMIEYADESPVPTHMA